MVNSTVKVFFNSQPIRRDVLKHDAVHANDDDGPKRQGKFRVSIQRVEGVYFFIDKQFKDIPIQSVFVDFLADDLQGDFGGHGFPPESE